MVFNSISFFLFFPIAVGIYFLLPQKRRWLWLLACSYFFYMSWRPEFIVLIMASTLVDYAVARGIASAASQQRKRWLLGISIAVNLGILGYFKYANFFIESIQAGLVFLGMSVEPYLLQIVLPVGISFYTFQTLGYTIDVYRGVVKPEKHLGIFATYVAFFPQLVAGPIERSKRLLPQFFENHKFEYERVVSGLRLMLWGLFKKIVVADRIAAIVSPVYADPTQFSSAHILLATVLFSFQIYADFSGYSDIAIGVARLMGFRLMENFRRPYFATSLADFWRRWHISLSTWFRDYVYIPLGGSRVPYIRWAVNIMIVFLVSGLWHGAAWTFVIWGGLHGLYLVLGRVLMPLKKRLNRWLHLHTLPRMHRVLQSVWVFFLVNIGWLFFRAESFQDVWYMCAQLISGWQDTTTDFFLRISRVDVLLAIFFILVMEGVHLLQERNTLRRQFAALPWWLRWGIYILVIFVILLFGVFEEREFIYFQF